MPHVSTAKQLDGSWLEPEDCASLPSHVFFHARWRRKFIAYFTAPTLGRLHLSKLAWDLPLLDVYRLTAGEEGVTAGYLLVTPCRQPLVSCSHVVAKPGTWDIQYTLDYVLAHQTKLKLRHTVAPLRFFTYGNLTLVVADNLPQLKAKLEL